MPASIVLAAIAIATGTDSDPDITFAKWQTFDARRDTVEIWLRPKWQDGQRQLPDYLLRRTVSYRPDLKLSGHATYWASSSTCPQGRAVLDQLSKLPTPTITVPGVSDEEAITVSADGASYRLVVAGHYPFEPGRIELTFGTKTPVASWIDQGFRSLATCWQKQRPTNW